jgi:hypothetical protein
MEKAAFNKKKTLFTGTLSLNLREKTSECRKANLIGHILCTNFLLKHITEEQIEGTKT